MRWCISIGNKISKVVPGSTVVVVLATLISQLSMVIASLLPLKVIMLLGASGIPHYFPSFFEGLNKDMLVVSLSLLSIVFFVAHSVSEKVIQSGSNKGAERLLVNSQKMALFENQKEIAIQGFQRYSRGMASVILIALISAALFWLYLELFLVILLFFILCFALLVFLYAEKESVKKELDETPGRLVGVATNVGFLIAFAFIVSDFLWGSSPSLLVAVMSLILMRQGFSRISSMVGDVRGLYGQKLRLNALFFHGHVFSEESKKHELSFWSFLQRPYCEWWIREVLAGEEMQGLEVVKVKWLQVGISDMAFLIVTVSGNSLYREDCLMKLFSSNQGAIARHEATLLASHNDLPALPLATVKNVQDLYCHVYNFGGKKKLPAEKLNEAKERVFVSLMEVSPDKDLVSRFNRSRPALWQRINGGMLERLSTVASMCDSESLQYVEEMDALLPCIKRTLEGLPLCYVNPDVGPNSIIEGDQGEFLVLHWGRWTLEPVGAGWPVNKKQLPRLSMMLAEARKKRKSLCEVTDDEIFLSALIFEFEKMILRQQFLPALKIIPDVISCVNARDC